MCVVTLYLYQLVLPSNHDAYVHCATNNNTIQNLYIMGSLSIRCLYYVVVYVLNCVVIVKSKT